jgi:hypothetical protein
MIHFRLSDFSEPSQMALSLTILGCQKSLDQLPRSCRTYNTTTQTNNVHVVIFNSLSCGEMVQDQGGSRTMNLVSSD